MMNLMLIGDGKDWARKIMARHGYGQKIGCYALRMAREVLGIPEPDRERAVRIDADGRVVRRAVSFADPQRHSA